MIKHGIGLTKEIGMTKVEAYFVEFYLSGDLIDTGWYWDKRAAVREIKRFKNDYPEDQAYCVLFKREKVYD